MSIKVPTRDNKWFTLAELILTVLITAIYLADFIPISATPYLLVLGWLSLWLRGLEWRSIGFRRPQSWRNALLLGVAVGVLFQFFSLYVMEPLIIKVTGKPIDLNEIALIEGNLFMLALFLVLVWTLAAFGEELVFRGYLMNRVAELLGGNSTAWVLSLLVVSILFGVIHLSQGISGVTTVIAAALVYGALYLWTGRNLWAPIIAHGVYDTVAIVLAYFGKFPGI